MFHLLVQLSELAFLLQLVQLKRQYSHQQLFPLCVGFQPAHQHSFLPFEMFHFLAHFLAYFLVHLSELAFLLELVQLKRQEQPLYLVRKIYLIFQLSRLTYRLPHEVYQKGPFCSITSLREQTKELINLKIDLENCLP